MKKRILSFLLVMALVVSMLPMTLFAAVSAEAAPGYTVILQKAHTQIEGELAIDVYLQANTAGQANVTGYELTITPATGLAFAVAEGEPPEESRQLTYADAENPLAIGTSRVLVDTISVSAVGEATLTANFADAIVLSDMKVTAGETEFTPVVETMNYGCTDHSCGHGTGTWTVLTAEYLQSVNYKLATGNYYLTGDVVCTKLINISAGSAKVNICLNGFDITSAPSDKFMDIAGASAVVNLCDCTATGSGVDLESGKVLLRHYQWGNFRVSAKNAKLTAKNIAVVGIAEGEHADSLTDSNVGNAATFYSPAAAVGSMITVENVLIKDVHAGRSVLEIRSGGHLKDVTFLNCSGGANVKDGKYNNDLAIIVCNGAQAADVNVVIEDCKFVDCDDESLYTNGYSAANFTLKGDVQADGAFKVCENAKLRLELGENARVTVQTVKGKTAETFGNHFVVGEGGLPNEVLTYKNENVAVSYVDGAFSFNKHYHADGYAGVEGTQEWLPWTDPDSLPTEAGYYYLTTDVTLAKEAMHGHINICLNGHTIDASNAERLVNCYGYIRIFCDCQGHADPEKAGKLIGGTSETDSLFQMRGKTSNQENGSRLYLYDLQMVARQESDPTKVHGAIYVTNSYKASEKESATLVMDGVVASGFHAYRGAIVRMVDVTAEKEAEWYSDLTLTIRNSHFYDNKADDKGGAIYLCENPTVTIENTAISDNTAANGGGIYVSGTEAALTFSGDTVIADNGTDLVYQADAQWQTPLFRVNELGTNARINCLYAAAEAANVVAVAENGSQTKWNCGAISYCAAADSAAQNISYLDTNADGVKEFVFGHYHEDANGNPVEYKPWTSATAMPTAAQLTELKGNGDLARFYLTSDVAYSTYTVPGNFAFCLNGHTIKTTGRTIVFGKSTAYTVTMDDCTATYAGDKYIAGGLTSTTNGTFGSGVRFTKKGTFIMNAGKLFGFKYNGDSAPGGIAVYAHADAKGSTFTMNGGEVCDISVTSSATGTACGVLQFQGDSTTKANLLGGRIRNINLKLTAETKITDVAAKDDAVACQELKRAQQSGTAYYGNATCVVKNLIVENITAETTQPGAAIYPGFYRASGSVSLDNVTFRNNQSITVGGTGSYQKLNSDKKGTSTTNYYGAAYGGAMYATTSTTVKNCLFENNTVYNNGLYGGGAFFCAVKMTLENCKFYNNSTAVKSGKSVHNGGAIYNNSTLTIKNCEFVGNESCNDAGAIYNNSTLTIESGTFDGNSAARRGGAIYNGKNTLTIQGGTFKNNSADSYGGFAFLATSANITGGTFEGNTGYKYGGAFYFESSSVVLTITGTADKPVVFDGNHAEIGTDGKEGHGSAIEAMNGTVNATYAVFRNNKADGQGAIRIGGGSASSKKWRADLTNCTFENNQASHGAAFTASKGSFTITNSEFKENAVEVGGGCIYISGSEAVTGTIDKCNFTDNSSEGSGGVITVRQSTTIGITNSTFEGNTAKTSGGAINLTGEKAITATIDNCDFIENSADSTSGAIHSVNSTTLTVTNSDFERNHADSDGGITRTGNYATKVTYQNCNFKENTSGGTGGALSLNYIGIATITDCVFENNSAAKAGGAVRIAGSSVGSRWNFTNCSFTGNETATSGGAIYHEPSKPSSGIATGAVSFVNCEMTGNKAANGGGAIYMVSGEFDTSLTLQDTVITGNSSKAYAAVLASGSANTDLYLKGATVIKDNICDQSDVYGTGLFFAHKTVDNPDTTVGGRINFNVALDVSGLTEGASIGLTVSETRLQEDPVVSSNGSAAQKDYFFCSNTERMALGTKIVGEGETATEELCFYRYIDGENQFATLQEYVTEQPADSMITLPVNADETLNVGSATINLNGKSVGKIVVAENETLKLVDTTTAGYDVENVEYSKVTVEGNVEPYFTYNDGGTRRYVVVHHGDNVYSAHRVYVSINSKVLRTANNGLGFKAMFAGDQVVEEVIDDFGIELCKTGKFATDAEYEADPSLGKTISAKYMTDEYDFENGVADGTPNQVCAVVIGVLKESNTQEKNEENFAAMLYGRPYIEIDGTRYYGAVVTTSMKAITDKYPNDTHVQNFLNKFFPQQSAQ